MIHFLVPAAQDIGIKDYLDVSGESLRNDIRVLHYEDLHKHREFVAGTYVLSALDQLNPALTKLVGEIHRQLNREKGVRFLNDPERTLKRFDLLTELNSRGMNDFRVARATRDLRSLRFPVFLREERLHEGAISPLLNSQREVRHAIGQAIVQGHELHDLLVVEFCDTANENGFYRKYGAFVVGNRVIPRSLNYGRHWMLKHAETEYTMPIVQEELKYVSENTHQGELLEIFKVAQVEYGRIDYGIKNGKIQTWEINLNPTIGRGLRDLDSDASAWPSGRVRRSGGGRKAAVVKQPGLLETLTELIASAIRGDPQAALLWVSRSQRHLAAELAAHEPALRASLAQALGSDPDPRFRARALSVLKDPGDFAPQVARALNDPDVRVREAAVRASATLSNVTPALIQRLAEDSWPLVRIAAADALAESSSPATAEPALARALDQDDSPHVRARVLLALGAHHATAALPKIRQRLVDKDEWPLVRAAAAQALAALCDASSVATLTDYANKLADPMSDANQHLIGAASLLALSDLRPSDLKARLSPLLAKGAPAQARQAADAVLRRRGACGKSAQPKEPAKVRGPAS